MEDLHVLLHVEGPGWGILAPGISLPFTRLMVKYWGIPELVT